MKEKNISSELIFLNQFQKEIETERDILLRKAVEGSNPKDMLFAQEMIKERAKKQKSFVVNPYYKNEANGYKNKPLELGYTVLRNMAKSSPVITAIRNTRKEQVIDYINYQTDESKVGWKIVKQQENYFEESDSAPLTEDEKGLIKYCINFIENCGVKSRLYHEDDFESFLRQYTDDSLILDQGTFEIIPNKLLKPYEFFATDGATYRFIAEQSQNPKDLVYINGYTPKYVQIFEGTVYNSFYPWELNLGIRNPSSDIYSNGYGISELEQMIKLVTWMLYSDTYNGKFFSQGSNPKGIFTAEDLNEDSLAEFKQSWKAQVSGYENAWKIPILSGAKVTWLDMQKSNVDMEFSKWQEYLIRLSCAIYKIDPREINFNLDSGDGINYDSVQEKIKYSKDKGLIPMLKHIAKRINKMIIGPLSNGTLSFIWTGLDDSVKTEYDKDIEKLEKGAITWKEFRRKHGLSEKIDKDDFLLNSTWVSIKQMQAQGNPDSNEFIEGENGGEQSQHPFNKQNPFNLLAEEEKEQNPFLEDLNDFVNTKFKEKDLK